MANTHCKGNWEYAASMAAYTRIMAADNRAQMSRLKSSLGQALREDITAKQREVLLLYYVEQLNMREIGERLGIDKSNVCRRIRRGEERLRRCLRYGDRALLESSVGLPRS